MWTQDGDRGIAPRPQVRFPTAPAWRLQGTSWKLGGGGGEGRHLKRCYLGCKHYPELRATATEAPCRRRLPGVPSLSSERGERFIPPEENPERSFQVQPREDSQNRTPATSSVLRTRSSPGGLRSCARDRNRSRVSNTGTCSLRSRSPDPV